MVVLGCEVYFLRSDALTDLPTEAAVVVVGGGMEDFLSPAAE